MDINENGAVLKTLITESQGGARVRPGEKVQVHYTGKLENGTKFDSSVDRGEPFEFTVAKGEVIKGWDIAVSDMKVGEKASFWIRSDYAYGKQGAGKDIPPDSNLLFEIEVLGIAQGEIPKKRLVEGSGDYMPIEGADVEINYTLSYKGKVIEEGNGFKLMMNDGTLLPGIHKCLEDMIKGDVVEAEFSSMYAYGATGMTSYGVPPNSNDPIVAKITLIDFEILKFPFEMTGEEIIAFTLKIKGAGNKFFVSKQYKLAQIQYDRALANLKNDKDFGEQEKITKSQIEKDVYLNLAACYIALKDSQKAIKVCDLSLKIDKTVKGYFRKAQALALESDYEGSIVSYKSGLEIDPNNKDLLAGIEKMKIEIKAHNEKEKKKFAGMFK